MAEFQTLIQKLQDDIGRAFGQIPEESRPEAVRGLQLRLAKLRAELEASPGPLPSGVTVSPLGQVRAYAQLKEILELYKGAIVPALVELEKQRLDVVLKMGQAAGLR